VSDVRKLQAAYEALVVEFLAPLLSGQTVRVGRPMAPGALPYFAEARSGSGEAESRIFDGLHRLGSEIAPLGTVPWPSRDLVAMVMVMHNLAFLTDPLLDRLWSRGSRGVVLEWVDELLEQIEPPSTRGDAAARYALLEAYLAMKRRDTVVRNWAYTYRFYGRPVPANVTALPRLRRVRAEQSDVDLWTLLAQVDDRHQLGLHLRLRRLVARSPVTELSRPNRYRPFRFGAAAVRVLSDAALRGGIARQIAAAGEWTCATALGEALAVSELHVASPALLAPVLRLLLEVHMTVALDSRHKARVPSTLDASSARYAAVLPAWLEEPTASEDVRVLDDGDRAILQRHAERLRRVVPAELIADTVALIARARTEATAARELTSTVRSR